jgi:cation diffusion facilitator family transporter
MASSDLPTGRNASIRRVLLGIFVANVFVVVVKLVIGASSRSLAVFGDGIQSSVDAVNNLVGLAVIGVASKGPDAEHPYGHAKFETLGALLIVVFLSVSIFELLRGAIHKLVRGGEPPTLDASAFILLGITLLVNVAVAYGENRAGRRLNSELLIADAMHTRTDVVITLAVLGGLGLTSAGLAWADPVLAIIVALFVAHANYGIVRRAMPTLVDQRAYDEGTIRAQAETVPGVRAAYAIRSRIAATRRFAELTISVDGRSDVASAHRIADAVEARLQAGLELDEVVVHVEPC